MATIVGYEWEKDLNPDFLRLRFSETHRGTVGVRDYRKPHGEREERIQVYVVGAPLYEDGRYGKFFTVARLDNLEEQKRARQILEEEGYEDANNIVF